MPEFDSRGLIDRAEILDVSLQQVHAEMNALLPPNAVRAVVTMNPPEFKLHEDHIYVRFRHHVEFRLDEESDGDDTGEAPVIGFVTVAHIVDLRYRGDPPTAEDIDAMIAGNVHFTVFPYVRAEVQRASASVRLPPVVLDFLRRPLASAAALDS